MPVMCSRAANRLRSGSTTCTRIRGTANAPAIPRATRSDALTRRKIDRHDDPTNQLLAIFEPDRTGILCRRDEYWRRRFAKHALGRRTKKQPAHPRQPVGADDDQIGGPLPRHTKDFRGGFTDRHLILRLARSRLAPTDGPAPNVLAANCASSFWQWSGVHMMPVPRSSASVSTGSSTVRTISRAPKCVATAAA